MLLACIVAGMFGPVLAWAQADRSHYRSVLKVSCDLPNGRTMKSTGFVWRDSRTVVTTLHGVAGCSKIIVYSEALNEDSRLATVERANLEADLALLKLDKPFDLPPLAHATAEPAVRGEHFTMLGYPRQTVRLSAYQLEFIEGMTGVTITLNDAYGSVDGQRELFRGVDFPKSSAAVFRVKTTIASGQSGAPIIDSRGRVVAIVDGGLLGGALPLNWSIAAHRYLPGLSNATDPIPTRPSQWTALMSSLTPAGPAKAVALPERAQAGRPAADTALVRVRSMTLDQLEAIVREKEKKNPGSGREESFQYIRSEIGAAEAKRLTFDVFEDPRTGATIGVPSRVELRWNPQLRALDAVSASGKVRVIIGVQESASFDEAMTAGSKAFVGKVMSLATWKSPAPDTATFTHFDRRMQHANRANFFDGADRVTRAPISVNLSLTASGRQLLGYAIFGPKPFPGPDLPPQDFALYFMMQLGAQHLSGFARQ